MGCPVGNIVGLGVGAAVGKFVGSAVGFAVGSLVGAAVGKIVGCAVGINVGSKDGSAVGSAVGSGAGSPSTAHTRLPQINSKAKKINLQRAPPKLRTLGPRSKYTTGIIPAMPPPILLPITPNGVVTKTPFGSAKKKTLYCQRKHIFRDVSDSECLISSEHVRNFC